MKRRKAGALRYSGMKVQPRKAGALRYSGMKVQRRKAGATYATPE